MDLAAFGDASSTTQGMSTLLDAKSSIPLQLTATLLRLNIGRLVSCSTFIDIKPGGINDP
jgi:hypothetical protein